MTIGDLCCHRSGDTDTAYVGKLFNTGSNIHTVAENVMLGAFLGIKDGIEAILASEGITCAQRAILEELRPIARNSDWDFTALKKTLPRSVKDCLP
jgi:hypothetical protein